MWSLIGPEERDQEYTVDTNTAGINYLSFSSGSVIYTELIVQQFTAGLDLLSVDQLCILKSSACNIFSQNVWQIKKHSDHHKKMKINKTR